jgi:hypothetical protein
MSHSAALTKYLGAVSGFSRAASRRTERGTWHWSVYVQTVCMHVFFALQNDVHETCSNLGSENEAVLRQKE